MSDSKIHNFKYMNKGSLNIQRTDRVFIVNDKVVIDGVSLPPAPIKNNSCCKCTVIDTNVYINGYEYKNGKWRRTLKAIWHYIFD